MESPARLLLIDDEEVFLLSTADLLRQEGYFVDCAMDGDTAARKLRETRYDLLISDIRLPGKSGLELLQDFPEPNLGLPVVLMTGYPTAETAIQAVNLAVLAYLLKPMEFQDLLVQVRRGVALRQVQLAATASALRIQDWAREMSRLAAGISGPGGVPVQRILGAMLGRMGETLIDMKQLVDLNAGVEVSGKVCSIQNCPRQETYHRIFSEGIETLEKTKEAFKSRNLQDLRHKMKKALENFPI